MEPVSRCFTWNKKSRNQQNQYFYLNFYMKFCISLLISKKEKEKLVIKLANEGKTTREIAKAVHISLKDIDKIIKR